MSPTTTVDRRTWCDEKAKNAKYTVHGVKLKETLILGESSPSVTPTILTMIEENIDIYLMS